VQLRTYCQQREECLLVTFLGFFEGLYRLLGILKMSDRDRLREVRQVVVVGSMSGLLQVAERCRDIRDRGCLEALYERFDMLVGTTFPSCDARTGQLHIAVAEGSCELELLLGRALRQEMLGCVPAKPMK
jgi:hypothetical protein